MKTVGIIGGLGPEATAKFYLEIIFSSQKLSRNHRPPVVISSVPLPYKLENDAIRKNLNLNKILPYLVASARQLEKAGTDFIVMPCNSLHLFIEDIRKNIEIPVLSILEETVEFLQNKNISNIAIISTTITSHYKLYEKKLIEKGIHFVVLDKVDQCKLDKIVYQLVMNHKVEDAKKNLLEIVSKFKDVDNIVLACTDLSIPSSFMGTTQVINTLNLLADVTVQKMLS